MKPNPNLVSKNGFALVVTISMMVLLTIVVVATLSLSTITLRAVDKDSAQAVARANARLALMLAIGQLQKEAGPDQRVTANADLDNGTANPSWTGVWKTGKNQENSKPTWLVSGANPDPKQALDEANSAVLSKAPSSDSTRKELRAEFVKVEGRQLDGRYAYWVGDEATKARVDVANPDERGKDLDFRERVGRSQSPQEPGFAAFDSEHKEMWAGFDSDYRGGIDRKMLVSMGVVALAAQDAGALRRDDIPNHYFNDLTTGGFGLPVNVKEGGMKKDLSLIFDTTQQNEAYVTDFLGAKPTATTIVGSRIYSFTPGAGNARKKFGLSETITNSFTQHFVGPNWGTLYNYARMWETVVNNKSPMFGLNPRVDSDLRQPNWKPYVANAKGDDFREDNQHTNSGLSPVIAMVQMGFLLGSEVDSSVKPVPGQPRVYNPRLMIKPVIGFWNPYNVHISPSEYQVEWATGPFLEMQVKRPTDTSPIAKNIWLREYWAATDNGTFPASGSQGGSWLRIKTSPVDFQPGELRLFSVEGNPIILPDGNGRNPLSPTLHVEGAFVQPLWDDPRAVNKVKIKYPAGTQIWFSRIDLQDTHPGLLTATKAKFGANFDAKAASSWFTMKASLNFTSGAQQTHLSRYTDVWNGGKDGVASEIIPEPILSGGSYAVKPKLTIENLGVARHLATWRFYTRNSTEFVDASQGARGWIDSNPRAMSNVLRFDGSSNTGSGVVGWNATSNLMGAEGDKDFGDGKGGNRGLVAEYDNVTRQIPQGVPTPNRWQGYTGPGSTATNSQMTHVIVYDVPQAPLTSIGQFQHAQLARYNYEPGFVVGNSYANPRIPLNSTVAANFASNTGVGFNLVDISYEVNNRLWDTVFFSTMGKDYKGGGSTSFDNAFDYNALVLRKKSLPNPRMIFSPLPGDTSIDKIIKDAKNDAPEALATRILVEGAFNVNSTSKTAWKAILSTMDGSELPTIVKEFPQTTQESDWVVPGGIRFSRFNHTILKNGFTGGGRDAAFWQGWRELTDKDLDNLAEAIVEEVKDRGPFRSMAEFVNRNPKGKPDHQRKGALQAAIDQGVNTAILEDVGLPASKPQGTIFSDAIAGENQTAGHAAYLLQGDILQCLAPIMQVRSDYFRIRTCGEALDKTGKVLAKVWCEAFVQRTPEYMDPADTPEIAVEDRNKQIDDYLKSDINKEFGRRFQLVSFRWLNPSEL